MELSRTTAAAVVAGSETISILLIDDARDDLLLIQRALEAHDPRYVIAGVSSPEEAYALLDERSFNLVLLDYKFPDGDGLEVIRTLKGKATYTPTVMVTESGEENIAIQAMREGALDFVPKTSGFVQVLPEVVSRALERGRIIRERIRTQSELARRNRELQALNEIASTVNESRDPLQVLRVAADGLAELLGARAAWSHLITDDGELGSDLTGSREPAGILGRRCIELAEPMVEKRANSCSVVVPLLAKERPVGILAFELPEAVDDDALDLAVSVGKQVGVAIEHARLYAALTETEAYLQDLVGHAGDEIVTIDRELCIRTWNSGAETLYGYTRDEVVGKHWDLLWPVSSRDDARTAVRGVLERGETVRNHETVRVTKNGALVEILLTLSPLTAPDGTIRGVASVGKNVSYQKQLQAQLIQAEKMAAVGQLISGVAHELNNPLTGVLGYAQLVASVDTGDKLQGYLEKIASEAGRCQKIVQNLLAFARKHEPKVAPVGLNSVLRETLDLRSYDLKVSNVDVVEDFEVGLPNVLADSHQLQQVFINIINNAHQALCRERGRGRIFVGSRLECRPNGQAWAVVSFDDDGPGVPPNLRSKIFDPFFTTKPVGEGTGLGLSLSYGIVQEHGGEITVGDSPVGGASFEVRLPVAPELLDAVEPMGRLSPRRQPVEPKRILVVDDQASIREIFTEILGHDGHQIDTAANGWEALQKLQSDQCYDLIIVDVRMPDFSGDRLYDEVASENPELASRIVFATGDVVSPETRSFLERSGNKFLAKPFGVEEIRSTLSSFFEETT